MPEFALADVAAHCTEDDCWIIIEDKVYDMTKFIPDHPGGKRALLAHAGTDATEAVRRQTAHTLARAYIQRRLGACYIGDIQESERAIYHDLSK